MVLGCNGTSRDVPNFDSRISNTPCSRYAERFLATVVTDKLRGAYLTPAPGA